MEIGKSLGSSLLTTLVRDFEPVAIDKFNKIYSGVLNSLIDDKHLKRPDLYRGVIKSLVRKDNVKYFPSELVNDELSTLSGVSNNLVDLLLGEAFSLDSEFVQATVVDAGCGSLNDGRKRIKLEFDKKPILNGEEIPNLLFEIDFDCFKVERGSCISYNHLEVGDTLNLEYRKVRDLNIDYVDSNYSGIEACTLGMERLRFLNTPQNSKLKNLRSISLEEVSKEHLNFERLVREAQEQMRPFMDEDDGTFVDPGMIVVGGTRHTVTENLIVGPGGE